MSHDVGKTWLVVRAISFISREPGTLVPTMGAAVSGCGASTTRHRFGEERVDGGVS